MQFYFIRHAQSENNAIWDKTRKSDGRKADPELTAIGQQQAQALATYLAQCPTPPDEAHKDPLNRHGYGFTHLYCSLMIRALETATPVAQSLDLPLSGWIDIHERGGIYDPHPDTKDPIGKASYSRAYLAERFPHVLLPDDLADSGWWGKEYETTDLAWLRARRVWDRLMEKHAGTNDRVAIVSHGGFFQSIMGILLNVSEKKPDNAITNQTWLRLNNVSISRFDMYDDFAVMSYMNRVDFLPTELIT